jgi:hypothetical protein
VQFAVASLSAASVLALFEFGWNPSINQAIEQLTSQAEIRDGELLWTGPLPERLGRGSFVAFVIDPDNSGKLGEAADIEWIFTQTELHIRSLFGYLQLAYPANEIISLDHQHLKPWWGAWRPVVYAGIGAVCVVGLLALWWTLAVLYVLPVRVGAFYLDREITWKGAWRLAGAAVLPGALFMDLATLAYALNRLNLLHLLAAAAAHIVVGWIYVFAATIRLTPLKSGSTGAIRPKNPFAPT